MTENDWNDELAADLRRDAATWEAAPSADATARLRAALAASPSRSPIVGPGLVAAAMLALMVWGLWGSTPEQRLSERPEPLALELHALTEDVNTLANFIWQQMPGILRRLLQE